MASLLEIDGLNVCVRSGKKKKKTSIVPIVRNFDLRVSRGEIVGLVGESGSGKSTVARAISRVLPSNMEVHGSVKFDGVDVLDLNDRDLRHYRASQVGQIYQDPRSRINPLRRIGDFVTEAVVRSSMSRDDAHARALELFDAVGIRGGEYRMRQFPFELSGGLLQRVMIASVLLAEPELIVADEPTTALDVTTQEEIVMILRDQCQERGAGMLFITHNLDLAASICERIYVAYAGSVAERAGGRALMDHPRHPYTIALLAARPSLAERRRIDTIPGVAARAFDGIDACAFAPRCSFATERCYADAPAPRIYSGSRVACHNAEEVARELEIGTPNE